MTRARWIVLAALGFAGCGEQAVVDLAPYTETIPGTDVTFDLVYVPAARAWLGTTEVTWAEYETFYLSEETPDGADAVARPSPAYLPYDRGWGRGARPAVGISRHAAEQYCLWLSKRTGRRYRLPTEREWEAACGAEAAAGWHAANSGEQTHEVAGHAPNAAGLFDLFGNAWEYCSGPFSEDDPSPVMRGGCWNTAATETPCALRRALPEAWNESDPQRPKSKWWLADGPFVGFRVARSP